MKQKIWRFKNNFFTFGKTNEERANKLHLFRQQLINEKIKIGIDQFNENLFSFYSFNLNDLQRAVDLYYKNDDIHYFVNVSKDKKFAILSKTKELISKEPLNLFIKKLWLIWLALTIIMAIISLGIVCYMFIILPSRDIINNILLPLLITCMCSLSVLYIVICLVEIIKRRRKNK